MNQLKITTTKKFKRYWFNAILHKSYYNVKTQHDLKTLLDKNCDERYLSYDCYGSRGSGEATFIESTPEELYDFVSATHTISNKVNIGEDNKVFFSDSKFPSLLLSRLDLKLKRTTKIDSADVIVSDEAPNPSSCIHNVLLIDIQNLAYGVVSIDGSSKANFKNEIKEIIDSMNRCYGYNMKLYSEISVANFSAYEVFVKNSNKYISTKDFTKYVVSRLPVLKEDECTNICYMLKSQDKSTVGTGLGTLQYYNFFDSAVDLLGALISTNCYDLPNNREAEYIYSLLGISRSVLIEVRNYSIKRKINFFMNAINRFVISPSMTVKEKVYTVLRSNLFDVICDQYKDEFNRLGVTFNLIVNDENGETNASSSEVEGEKV